MLVLTASVFAQSGGKALINPKSTNLSTSAAAKEISQMQLRLEFLLLALPNNAYNHAVTESVSDALVIYKTLAERRCGLKP